MAVQLYYRLLARATTYPPKGRNSLGLNKYATEETFELSPLPCWAHLSPEAYRERVAALVAEIEQEAATALARSGRQPLGVAGILRQNPQTRPNGTKKSPAPAFHAATKATTGSTTQTAPDSIYAIILRT